MDIDAIKDKRIKKGKGKAKSSKEKKHQSAKPHSHQSSNPKAPTKAIPTSTSPLPVQSSGCFVCGRPGHYANRCPQKQDRHCVNAMIETLSGVLDISTGGPAEDGEGQVESEEEDSDDDEWYQC